MPISDRVLGVIILIASVAGLGAYFWWLFLSPWHWWAIVVPVFVGVATIAVIAAWIGWTMATTPPPTLPEEVTPPEEEKPEKAKEKKKASARKK